MIQGHSTVIAIAFVKKGEKVAQKVLLGHFPCQADV